ncbi:hypothetical protein, partial [Klebsiella pneumoniae]|uniref:hypothetical protein n=1 Tax=Klebsiella pneumoniae TaxID=573 RepID=UPI001C608B16
HWSPPLHWIRRPRKRSAAGHGPSLGAVCMPGGGYALPGLQTKRSASRGVSRVAQTGNSA